MNNNHDKDKDISNIGSGIIRTRKDTNYVAISHLPLRDTRLSWAARGILAYLISKPDNWQVKTIDLINSGPHKRDYVLARLKELETYGYLHRTKFQSNDGRWNWISEVYETPVLAENHAQIREPHQDLPYTAFPYTVQPYTVDPVLLRSNELNINELRSNESSLGIVANATEPENKKTTKSARKTKAETIVCEDFKPTDETVEFIKAEYPNVANQMEDQIERFILYYLSNERKYVNWQMVFRNWMNKQQSINQTSGGRTNGNKSYKNRNTNTYQTHDAIWD